MFCETRIRIRHDYKTIQRLGFFRWFDPLGKSRLRARCYCKFIHQISMSKIRDLEQSIIIDQYKIFVVEKSPSVFHSARLSFYEQTR